MYEDCQITSEWLKSVCMILSYIEAEFILILPYSFPLNSAEFTFPGGTHKYKTDAVIYSNGSTIWLAPAMFVTVCQLDVR